MLAVAELQAPPEVLRALQDGRRSGQWIRARCPYCDPEGRRRRNLAASHTGFGKHRDRPGWVCHACHAEKDVQRAKRQQQTMSLRYDPTRAKNDRKRRIEKARQIIENSSSIHDGDFVDRYLRGRKLRPHGSLWPSSLRKAQLWHPQTRKTHPAMVGIVTDVQNMAIAVHRTYLTEDGRKAEVEPVKMSLGPVGGGAIRLGVDSDTIIVAEGIESALGAAMVYNVVPWATLSAGNMEVLQIPKSVKQVIIAPDNDRSSNPRKNEVGYKAALKLRNRIKAVQKEQDRIIHVRVVYPPRGRTDFADFG